MVNISYYQGYIYLCPLTGRSIILIGVVLGILRAKLSSNVHTFTGIIAPDILVMLGFLFIYKHHKHKHFILTTKLKNKRKIQPSFVALVMAMFFSPYMEIEAYFLLAGALRYLAGYS